MCAVPGEAGVNFRNIVTNTPSTLSGSGHVLGLKDPSHGLMFDPGSTDNYAALAYDSPSTNTATITAWFYARTRVELATIVSAFGARAQGLIINRELTSDALTYMWENSADEYDGATGLQIPLNTMCFGAVSVTPTAATVYLAYPGSFASWTNTKAHSAKVMSSWAVGDDIDVPGGRTFDGLIGEWRVYPQRALSDSEIRQIYNPETRWDLYHKPTSVYIDLPTVPKNVIVPARPREAKGVRPEGPYLVDWSSPQAAYGFTGWWVADRGVMRRMDRPGRNAEPIVMSGTPTSDIFRPVTQLGYCGQTEQQIGIIRAFDTGVPALDGLSSFTIAYWLHVFEVNGFNGYWGQSDTTVTFLEKDGPYLHGVGDFRGQFTDAHSLGLQHVAWVLGGGQLSLYRDGKFVSQVAATGTINAATNYGLYIGGVHSGTGAGQTASNAVWADFRVIPAAVSPSEIQALYAPETRWELYGDPQLVMELEAIAAAQTFNPAWARGSNRIVQPGLVF